VLATRHIILLTRPRQIFVFAFLLVTGILLGQNEGIKSGVNIQASYYNNGNVNIGWELMAEYPEIEAVRIEIEPYRAHQARQWIKEAHEHGYQVIATYHDSEQLGTDDREVLMDAAEWWVENYESLSSTGPIIINIMNEWGSHEISSRDYADAYKEVIEIIRTVYEGVLIVDIPGFGQAIRIAADAFPLFEEQDLTFSVHVYTSAFNIEEKRWLSHDDLLYLDATGADCIVGEFCDTQTGGADWCSIIDHCYQSGWPLFGWAWNGDGGNMNMIEPHWDDEPLAESFEPTEFLQKIVNKLAGVPCFTVADEDCSLENIGDTCNDGNDYTVNDRYNEYCHCTGNYTPLLQNRIHDSELIIYPNPVRENQELTIELFKIHVNGEIRIFNSLGQTVKTHPINLFENKVYIDTQGIQSGLYWASFQTDEKVYASKAFVIQ
jgi:hypothetical protein